MKMMMTIFKVQARVQLLCRGKTNQNWVHDNCDHLGMSDNDDDHDDNGDDDDDDDYLKSTRKGAAALQGGKPIK